MATFKYLIPLFLFGLLISCGSSNELNSPTEKRIEESQSKRTQNYTAAFPQTDVSSMLKQVQQSIVRIVATGFYESYSFSNKLVTLSDINTNGAETIATSRSIFEESTAGTSIILDQRDRNFLLISAEHVVSFPDTAITYYQGEQYPTKRYIKSISILRRKVNLIYTGQEIRSFDIVVKNDRLDLALLNIELKKVSNIEQYPIGLKFGDTSRLQLGSFLYMLGFPKGYAMVTRGLASSSESWNDRFFVTDAVFNPGISGGPILASRDNFSSFEWIGMVSSATASYEDVLVPRPNAAKYSRITQPYQDTAYVAQKARINYGIAQAIPINRIKEFLQENQEEINKLGYSLKKHNLSL